MPSATSIFAGIGADLAKGGLAIGDRLVVFDKKSKIDPATG